MSGLVPVLGYIAIALGITLFGLEALAAEPLVSTVSARSVSIESSETLGGSANRMDVYLDYSGSAYLSQRPSQYFGIGLEGAFSVGPGVANVEFQGGLDITRPREWVIAIPEAHIEYTSAQGSVSIGRHRASWSMLDESWMLGVFNPRLRQDYFRPREQGLVGLFAEFGSSTSVRGRLFVSPLFIPEQGAQFAFENGRCASDSPFFGCPNRSVFLFQEETALRAEFDLKSIARILLQPSIGASIGFGAAPGETGLFLDGSAMVKPMNQVQVGYEGFLNLDTLSADVTLHPRSVYHQLYSLETGVRWARSSVYGSVIRELPIEDSHPADWTTQQSSPATLLGTGVNLDLYSHRTRTGSVSFDYLQVVGGAAPDQGPLASGDKALLETFYPWSRAVRLRARAPFLGVDPQLSWVYDFEQRGSWLQASVGTQVERNIRLEFSADFLGADAEFESGIPVADFISRYRGLDRIRGGMTYVF